MRFLSRALSYAILVTAVLLLITYGWVQNISAYFLLLTVLVWLGSFVFFIVQMISINKTINQALKLFSIEGLTHNKYKVLLEAIHTSKVKLEITANQIRQINSLRAVQSIHPLIAKDDIGIALREVQQEISKLKHEEDHRHWIAEGLARFGELLRRKDRAEDFYNRVVCSLVRYVDANQGGLFLHREGTEEGEYLELVSCYAYDKQRIQQKKIYPGQGVLGQCMFEKDVIFLTDVPKDYIKITSGLGLSVPRNIVVIPLMINQKFYGALELASFEVLQPYQIEFLKEVSENIASELDARRNLENTNKLLADSKALTNELQSSEEALKKNLTELASAQESMKLKQIELTNLFNAERRLQIESQKKQAELNSYLTAINNTIATAEFDLIGNFISANDIFLKIMGYTSVEIKLQNYGSSMIDITASQIMWDNLRVGKFFSGEFKMRDKFGKEIWLNGTFNPIYIQGDVPEKVMMCAQFTTREKEKLNDLNVMVNALKSSLPVVEFNDQFKCKTANDKFLKMFNVSRLDLRNKTLYDFIDPNYKEIFESVKMEILKKESSALRLPIVVEGKSVTYEASISITRNSNAELSRVILILVKEIELRIPILAAVG